MEKTISFGEKDESKIAFKIHCSEFNYSAYYCEISRIDSPNLVSKNQYEINNIEIILGFLGTEDPTDLLEKIVEVPSRLNPHISNVVKLMTLLSMNGGNYYPPKIEDVEESILYALSIGAEYKNSFDEETVFRAARNLFRRFADEFEIKGKIEDLSKEVNKRSGNKIEIAESKDFKLQVVGPNAYLRLKKPNGDQLISFGPYVVPITLE